MNAKDYGVAQNRERIFIVSILGESSYSFPKPFPLVKRLKDYLEENVDEKYYLSKKMVNYIFSEDSKYKVNKNSLPVLKQQEGSTRADTSDYITQTCLLKNQGRELSKITDVANTLLARDYKGFGNQEMDAVIKIPEATKKGYAEAEVGDGVYLNRPHQKRGVVQKGMIQTIKTRAGDLGVVVLVPYGSYYTWEDNKGNLNTQCNRAVGENGVALTVAAAQGGSVVEQYGNKRLNETLEKHEIKEATVVDAYNKTTHTETSPTITTRVNESNNVYLANKELRIRKLTPKETWRLMGISDEDFDKAQASGISDSQLYKQAGNAIVVDVLYYIFKNLFDLEEKEKIK